jgi:hypothetical protein
MARKKKRKSKKSAGRKRNIIPPDVVLKRVRKLYNNRKNPAWREAMNHVVG